MRVGWIADGGKLAALAGGELIAVNTVDGVCRSIFTRVHAPLHTSLVEKQCNGAPALIATGKAVNRGEFIVRVINIRFVVEVACTDPQAIAKAIVLDGVDVLYFTALESPAHVDAPRS